MVTAGWLSSAVEKVCVFLVGMVVFFSINAVMTPPMVSIPRLSGVTSSSNTSLTSPDQHRALQCGTDSHSFIGVNVFAGFLAKELSHLALYQGHTRLPTDQNHVIDFTG